MSSHPGAGAPSKQAGQAKGSPWLTRRSVAGHIALVIWIPGCVIATYWQVGIALSGDNLGWVYSVMWPCFAFFGVVFWWFLVHDDPETVGARGLRRAAASSTRAAGTGHASESSEAPSRATPDPSEAPTAPRAPPAQGSPVDESDANRLARAEENDPELADYNAYLASLSERGKTWRRR